MARKLQTLATGHTILVVDDQEETLESVRRLLEREGHRVLTAASGEHALTLFEDHEFDLLLVDYFMPRMTGEELVRELRTFDPYVQIILQTGYSGEKPPRKMLAELDIQGYHDKGEGPEKLLLWVDVGLKAHRVIRRLRERERWQAELIASVSHEFRTPLTVIDGYIKLMRDGMVGELPAEALPPLRAVEDANRCLKDLVADLLTYAKLRAGMLDVKQEWVSIGSVTKDLQALGEVLLKRNGSNANGVSFSVQRQGAPIGFLTDPVKFHIILRHLLANAVKFTKAGSICMQVKLDGDIVRFALRDTGPGIGKQERDLIFEPFRQLDGSVTRCHSGIGLGLGLSIQMAQLLGGTIEVESEPGVGSTFTLALPAEGVAHKRASDLSSDRAVDLQLHPEVAAA